MGNSTPLYIVVFFLVTVGNGINGFTIGPKAVFYLVSKPAIFGEIATYTKDYLHRLKFIVTSIVNHVSHVYRKILDSDEEILGSACYKSANCSTVNDAACLRGICSCNSNFTIAYNTPNKCLKVLKLGETCEEDVQCSTGTVGSFCAERCVCYDITYKQKEYSCVTRNKIGDKCEKDDDCLVSIQTEEPFLRQCVNNTCSCKSGYASDDDDNHCMKAYKYQLQVSLALLLIVFVVPYLL